MRNTIFLFFILSSAFIFSQNIVMQNGTFNQCMGNFYDSGDVGGVYGDNENFTLTICPDTPGMLVEVDFTAFSTQMGADVLTIYNGDSNAAPTYGPFSGNLGAFQVSATPANPTGCLTFEWVSDGATVGNGWEGRISCYMPCQTIVSQIDTANPAPDPADGVIKVCQGQQIDLTGSGMFSGSGAGATYEWDLGDGNTIAGQTASFSYPNAGVYEVNLNITDTNPEGCTNTNLINQVIQVSPDPDFTGTQAAEDPICFGDSTTIQGIVNPVTVTNNCAPPVSQQTALPDGNGVSYETSILVECYDPSETLTDVNQIISICMNIEHSWSGDLDIFIISPNGQMALLFDGTNGTFLGNPNGADNGVPGIGEEYCFSESAATLLNNAPIITSGNPPGNAYQPGTYLPQQSYNSLLGSPLNGQWTIRVTDNLPQDDGTIFSWGINFDPSLLPPDFSFTPTIVTEAWDADPSITNTTGNTITVQPATAGQHCYTYRVVDDFGCEYTEQVCIDVNPEIITEVPDDLTVCDASGPPFVFDLSQNTPVVLASAPNPGDLVVTYHENMADAQNDASPVPDPTTYSGTDGQVIYIRIEYQTSGCYEIETFTLFGGDLPTANPVSDMIVCDDASNDGTEIFDLTSQESILLGGDDPATVLITYHTSQTDADNNVGAIATPTAYPNPMSPQPIVVRVQEVGTLNCYVTTDFDLIVNPLPQVIPTTPLQLCDDYVADGITVFNLTDKDAEITGGNTNLSVVYYETLADAQAGTSPIPDPTAYTNTSVGGLPANPQTLYVTVTDTSTTSNCSVLNTLVIEVLENPTPFMDPDDIVLCDDNGGNDETEVFDLTIREVQIFNGQPYTATYHTSESDADQDIGAIATPTAYSNTANPETIYVRVENADGCHEVVDFDLIVNPLPEAIGVTDLIECELNTDGLFDFDLESKTNEILNGQSPAIFVVTYHETQADADANANPLSSPYTNLLGNPQPIYVSITNGTTGCAISTQNFNIEVRNQPTATQPAQDYIVCDYLDDNDGFAEFDLSSQDAEILNGQLPADYTVTYYDNPMDAIDNVNELPNLYQNTSNPQVIYARVSNNQGVCYELTEVTLRVQLIPEINLDENYIICLDRNGNVITTADSPPVLDTGLSDADHTFEWSYEGTVLPGETMSTLTATQAGNYSVIATETTTGLGCMGTDTTTVTPSSPPMVDAVVVSDAFSDNHTIEVTATGTGVYEFSLDNGPWELGTDNGDGSYTYTFSNVNPPGEHIVQARDVNGCGMDEDSVFVFDYPLYFTPNGDGFNDTWNIIDFSLQPTAKIYIYDRYGKLLKQLSPTGEGWTGLYNGKPLPSSDYWFTVSYIEPRDGTQKQFKAHFTLKR